MGDTRAGGWAEASVSVSKHCSLHQFCRGTLERQYVIVVKGVDSVARLPCLKPDSVTY